MQPGIIASNQQQQHHITPTGNEQSIVQSQQHYIPATENGQYVAFDQTNPHDINKKQEGTGDNSKKPEHNAIRIEHAEMAADKPGTIINHGDYSNDQKLNLTNEGDNPKDIDINPKINTTLSSNNATTGIHKSLLIIYIVSSLLALYITVLSFVTIINALTHLQDMFDADFTQASMKMMNFNLIFLSLPMNLLIFFLSMYLASLTSNQGRDIGSSQVVTFVIAFLGLIFGIINFFQLNISYPSCSDDTDLCAYVNSLSLYVISILPVVIILFLLFALAQCLLHFVKKTSKPHLNQKEVHVQQVQEHDPNQIVLEIHHLNTPKYAPTQDGNIHNNEMNTSFANETQQLQPINNKHQESPKKNQEPPKKNQESPMKKQESSMKNQESPMKNQESSMKNQESPKKNQESPMKNSSTMKNSSNLPGQLSAKQIQNKNTESKEDYNPEYNPFNKYELGEMQLNPQPHLIHTDDPYVGQILEKVHQMVNMQVKSLLVDLKSQNKI